MNLYHTFETPKTLKYYENQGTSHINKQQKESTQKLFLNKNEKLSREQKVSVFFQQDQTTITKTNHKGFAWLKHKKKHKKHNHNRILEVPEVYETYRLLQTGLLLTDSVFVVLVAYFDETMDSIGGYQPWKVENTVIQHQHK